MSHTFVCLLTRPYLSIFRPWERHPSLLITPFLRSRLFPLQTISDMLPICMPLLLHIHPSVITPSGMPLICVAGRLPAIDHSNFDAIPNISGIRHARTPRASDPRHPHPPPCRLGPLSPGVFCESAGLLPHPPVMPAISACGSPNPCLVVRCPRVARVLCSAAS